MNTLTLPTGRTVPLAEVRLDVAAQRFDYYGADVTDYLSPSQKRTFPGFDVPRAAREASDAARAARGLPPVPDNLETSTWRLWAGGVGDDVAAGAEGVRAFAGIGPEHAGKRSPLFWFIVLGGAGLLAYQLGLFAWVKKKLTA